MRLLAVVVGLTCTAISLPAMAQTMPPQTYPPPFVVPQPADIVSTPTYGVTVTDNGTEVHAAPGAASPVVTTLDLGNQVTVLGTSGGWSRVSSAGVEGYVNSESLKK
jgi:uncharacterized protein YgiM (DUF1202 family)